MAHRRVRRISESVFILGLSLLAASAVAFAEDPTPAEGPPAPVATSTPEAVVATPEPSPTTTPEPTATEEPVVTATPVAEPTASATVEPPVAPKERIDICHATGSSTNPYVLLNLPANALNGHDGHAGDIIPAPATGCPVAAEPTATPTPDAGEKERVDICHATGSATNPYVLLNLPLSALNGHGKHEGDIIPAPAAGCPATTEPGYSVPSPEPTASPEPTVTASPEATTTPTPDGSGTAPSGGQGNGPAATPLQSENRSLPTPAAEATAPAPQPLPFTGLEVWLLAAAGLGLTLMGAGMRVLASPGGRSLAMYAH